MPPHSGLGSEQIIAMSDINILECHREIDMKTDTDMDTYTNSEKRPEHGQGNGNGNGTRGQRCLAKGPQGAIGCIAPYG
jgi:hypothetical protein